MGNAHFAKAKKGKNDEFYTQREDVNTELEAYIAHNPDLFRDKTVYLPADRGRGEHRSVFWDFFKENAARLGLRKLIATSFKDVLHTAQHDKQSNGDRGALATLTRNAAGDWEEHHQRLEGDGDLRSWEVYDYYLEADVIVTNPPFSCLKYLIEIVHGLGKSFLLVVPFHALNYRRVFQKLWRGEAWLGTSRPKRFLLLNPDATTTECDVSSMWLTNLPHGKQNKPLPSLRTMAECRKLATGTKYEATLYQPYDNLDAIEVPRLEYLPTDYDGLIGVPMTVLPYLCGCPPSGVECKKKVTYTEPLTPTSWEALWKMKTDIPFYEYGLVETQKTSAPREGKMRDYWGCTIGNTVLYTRIIVRWKRPQTTDHRPQTTDHRSRSILLGWQPATFCIEGMVKDYAQPRGNGIPPSSTLSEWPRPRSASRGWPKAELSIKGMAQNYAQPRGNGQKQSSALREWHKTTLSLEGMAHNYKGGDRVP